MKKVVDYYNGLSKADCERLNLKQQKITYFICDKCSNPSKFNYNNQDLCPECFKQVIYNKWLQLSKNQRGKILAKYHQYYCEIPTETMAKELKINFKKYRKKY